MHNSPDSQGYLFFNGQISLKLLFLCLLSASCGAETMDQEPGWNGWKCKSTFSLQCFAAGCYFQQQEHWTIHGPSPFLSWMHTKVNPKYNILGCKPEQVSKDQHLDVEDSCCLSRPAGNNFWREAEVFRILVLCRASAEVLSNILKASGAASGQERTAPHLPICSICD